MEQCRKLSLQHQTQQEMIELFGADYAAIAVFEISNSKMSIGNH